MVQYLVVVDTCTVILEEGPNAPTTKDVEKNIRLN
jgi:hypothetical protein